MDVSRLPKSEERADAPLLLVEDDRDLRTSLTDILENEGYVVIAAGDLGAAREVLSRVRPAAVLLDLRLQGESSEPFLAELSRVDNPQATVVVSGSANADAIARDYGVLSVPKPFDIETLLDAVRRAIASGIERLSNSPKRQSSPGKAQ